MPDLLDALAKVTGLPRTEMVTLAEQVRANIQKLDSCAWHEFAPLPDASNPTRQKYRCLRCGGDIDRTAYRWHEIGRRPAPDAQSDDRQP